MPVGATISPPEKGQMVKVRGGIYLVTEVLGQARQLETSGRILPAAHLVRLTSLMNDALGEELSVLWELEPGARVFEDVALPEGKGIDPPHQMQAFLNAVRWGAASNAEYAYIQAPFRCGVAREEYQLEPLMRAVEMPRANLLIADDVGLGKTIEAGLVMQELIFRHRVHRILIVCPAALQIQWREQMRDKFGLEFQIVDSERVRALRRERGVRSNPWTHFPRLITSIDYLKREKALKALQDLLPGEEDVVWPRSLDLLVLDEAHMVAPAGSGKYAVDSQRTRAIRLIAPHCEHKLFLTATPHNGYPESFSALLELLDNQRFTRGLQPNPEQLKAVMIRRLKSDLVDWDGRPLFPVRRLQELPVTYTAAEDTVLQALHRYGEMRRKHVQAGGHLVDFVIKLLKKRLQSSPLAFLKTLDTHLETLQRQRSARDGHPERVKHEVRIHAVNLELALESFDSTEFATDQEYEQQIHESLELLATRFDTLTPEELALLVQMRDWAETAASKGDSKLKELMRWLKAEIAPDGHWGDQRVIVFTEYRDTLYWLQDMLKQHKLLSKDRVLVLEGGMDPQAREAIKAAFQASPAESAVRILLATDAASEGIDLQNHCHRLIHYEIPWNPNRLEQRNGRIDRHGQRFDPQIHHFVPSDYQKQSVYQAKPGTWQGDLEFLMRAVRKVEQIRIDLGKVGPVIAAQVEQAMLGRAIALNTYDAEQAAQRARHSLVSERNLRENLHKLSERLKGSAKGLQITPAHIQQVVECGLALAGQPPLRPATLPGVWPDSTGRFTQCPIFWMPALTHQWAICSEGLHHPHTGRERPITFDADLVRGRDDLVLVHLNHRLVQMCLRLLRAEVWSQDPKLHRMAVQMVPDHVLDTPGLLTFARLVVVGGQKELLHEEIVTAGGTLREGQFKPFEYENQKQQLLNTAWNEAPVEALHRQLLKLWPSCTKDVARALNRRMRIRTEPILKHLGQRCDKEVDNLGQIMNELARSIEQQLNVFTPVETASGEQLAMDDLLSQLTVVEQRQFQRDRDNLRYRLELIPDEKAREIAAIRQRFDSPRTRLFPVGVVWYVPVSLGRRS
ncbi:MAG: DISARM system SNF2-like helicase DrmD [Candidatus Sericytochromatia bacterium]